MGLYEREGLVSEGAYNQNKVLKWVTDWHFESKKESKREAYFLGRDLGAYKQQFMVWLFQFIDPLDFTTLVF